MSQLISCLPIPTRELLTKGRVLLSNSALLLKRTQTVNVFVSNANVVLVPLWKGDAVVQHIARRSGGEEDKTNASDAAPGCLIMLAAGTRMAHTFTWTSGQASAGIRIIRLEYSTTLGSLKYIPLPVSELILNRPIVDAPSDSVLRSILDGALLLGFVFDCDKGPFAPLKRGERSLLFVLEGSEGYKVGLHFFTSQTHGKLWLSGLHSPDGQLLQRNSEECEGITAYVGLQALEYISQQCDLTTSYPESFYDEFVVVERLTNALYHAATLVGGEEGMLLGAKILWHGLRMLCDNQVQGKAEPDVCTASLCQVGTRLGEYVESMGEFHAAATMYESLFLSIRDSKSHDASKATFANNAAVAFSRSGEHELAEIYYMESLSLRNGYEEATWNSWSRLYFRMGLHDLFIPTRQLCVDTAFRTKRRTARIRDAARTGCISTLRIAVKSILSEISPSYLMNVKGTFAAADHEDDKKEAEAYIERLACSEKKDQRVLQAKFGGQLCGEEAEEREAWCARYARREEEEGVRLQHEEKERLGKAAADRWRRYEEHQREATAGMQRRTRALSTKKKKSKTIPNMDKTDKMDKHICEKVISIENAIQHSEHLTQMEALRIREMEERVEWVRMGRHIGGS